MSALSVPVTVARHKGHGQISGQYDVAVVIDVIRAFTFAKTAFDNGAERILLAETISDARALAARHPDALLAGEVEALPIDGFDFGNSPAQIAGLALDGRTIIHRTSNGTRMAIAALDHASHVLVTGLSNVRASATRFSQLAAAGARSLLLVATHPTGDEDVACGDHLLALLHLPDGVSDEEALARTRHAEAAQKFLDPTQPAFPSADMEHVLSFHEPAFFMAVSLLDGIATVRKVPL